VAFILLGLMGGRNRSAGCESADNQATPDKRAAI